MVTDKIENDIMEKKRYIVPCIEIIFLDNEISLALESNPPIGPNEEALLSPKYFNSDPFRNNLG